MKIFADINAVTAAKKKYMVYKNQVLDVEGFDHPGSVELIEDNLGKDVTELFDEQGHSGYARSLMEKLRVGYIQGHKLLELDDTMTKEERQLHEKLDRMVDITKPLVPQVRAMTNKEFMAFVSKPRHVDDTDCITFYEDEKMEYYYRWR